MSIIFRILIGLGITGVGAFIVIKTRSFIDFFGYIDWAEQKLGGGGTILMYKFIGLALCVIGIIVATNLWEAFLGATIGALLPQVSVSE